MLNCTIFNLSVAWHAEPLPSCTCLLLLVLYLTLIESCCNILQQTLITIAKLSCFTCTSIKAKIDFFTRTPLLKRECFHVRVLVLITVCLCSIAPEHCRFRYWRMCFVSLTHYTLFVVWTRGGSCIYQRYSSRSEVKT